ncbi:hypothetical protein CDIK_2189 [Cucumispora dikerogammari]|nr:hypothetical protein CDIK_2189 [Cucumispora dikerogammari]
MSRILHSIIFFRLSVFISSSVDVETTPACQLINIPFNQLIKDINYSNMTIECEKNTLLSSWIGTDDNNYMETTVPHWLYRARNTPGCQPVIPFFIIPLCVIRDTTNSLITYKSLEKNTLNIINEKNIEPGIYNFGSSNATFNVVESVNINGNSIYSRSLSDSTSIRSGCLILPWYNEETYAGLYIGVFLNPFLSLDIGGGLSLYQYMYKWAEEHYKFQRPLLQIEIRLNKTILNRTRFSVTEAQSKVNNIKYSIHSIRKSGEPLDDKITILLQSFRCQTGQSYFKSRVFSGETFIDDFAVIVSAEHNT